MSDHSESADRDVDDKLVEVKREVKVDMEVPDKIDEIKQEDESIQIKTEVDDEKECDHSNEQLQKTDDKPVLCDENKIWGVYEYSIQNAVEDGKNTGKESTDCNETKEKPKTTTKGGRPLTDEEYDDIFSAVINRALTEPFEANEIQENDINQKVICKTEPGVDGHGSIRCDPEDGTKSNKEEKIKVKKTKKKKIDLANEHDDVVSDVVKPKKVKKSVIGKENVNKFDGMKTTTNNQKVTKLKPNFKAEAKVKGVLPKAKRKCTEFIQNTEKKEQTILKERKVAKEQVEKTDTRKKITQKKDSLLKIYKRKLEKELFPQKGDKPQEAKKQKTANSCKEVMTNREVKQIGIWVQCSLKTCNKWRYLEETHDPTKLPELWNCSMNQDPTQNSCDAKEASYDPATEKEDFIHTKYVEGSIVWAHMAGYPWWPSIVEVDPDYQIFFECRFEPNIASHYHVTFLDEKVTRAWFNSKSLRAFTTDDNIGSVKIRGQDFRKSLSEAKNRASQALKLDLPERISQFGFASHFKGRWGNKKGGQASDLAAEASTSAMSKDEPYAWKSDTDKECKESEDEASVFGSLSGQEVDEILDNAESIIESAHEALIELLSQPGKDCSESVRKGKKSQKTKKVKTDKEPKKPKKEKADKEPKKAKKENLDLEAIKVKKDKPDKKLKKAKKEKAVNKGADTSSSKQDTQNDKQPQNNSMGKADAQTSKLIKPKYAVPQKKSTEDKTEVLSKPECSPVVVSEKGYSEPSTNLNQESNATESGCTKIRTKTSDSELTETEAVDILNSISNGATKPPVADVTMVKAERKKKVKDNTVVAKKAKDKTVTPKKSKDNVVATKKPKDGTIAAKKATINSVGLKKPKPKFSAPKVTKVDASEIPALTKTEAATKSEEAPKTKVSPKKSVVSFNPIMSARELDLEVDYNEEAVAKLSTKQENEIDCELGIKEAQMALITPQTVKDFFTTASNIKNDGLDFEE